jgi:hypothetical protein
MSFLLYPFARLRSTPEMRGKPWRGRLDKKTKKIKTFSTATATYRAETSVLSSRTAPSQAGQNTAWRLGKEEAMKVPAVFRLFGSCFSLLAAGTCAVLASGAGAPVVTGPSDLAEELRDAQFLAPPCVGLLDYDAGEFVFVPDGTDPDAELLAKGLVPAQDGTRETICPIVLVEDPETRETVFENAAGGEILRLPAEIGYSPVWVLAALYPAGDAPADAVCAYEPSRVRVGLRVRFSTKVLDSQAGTEANRWRSKEEQRRDVLGLGASDVHRSVEPAERTGREKPGSAAGIHGASEGAKRGSATTWYVDSDVGKNEYDGLSWGPRGARKGPKASLQQAIDAARSGDVVEIRGRSALPDPVLRPHGKLIRLRPQGVVRL